MMKKNITYLVATCMMLLIVVMSGCGGKDAAYVAPLIQFDQTMAVKTFWTTLAGGGKQKEGVRLMPTLYGNRIYIATNKGQVTAVDTKTGKRVWQANVKESISSGVGVSDAMLYMGTRKGEVIAMDHQKHHIVWRTPVSNEILSNPVVVDGVVFVKSIDDHVYALNGQNGAVIWSYRQPPGGMTLRGGGAPRVAGNKVVVGFSDGSVEAFERHNGGMLWGNIVSRPSGGSMIEQMTDINNAIAVSDGVVYVATYRGAIVALGLNSGEILWEKKVPSHEAFAFDAHNIYISDSRDHLWALNRKTGKMMWRQENLTGRGITAPVVLGNIVVVADNQGFVHWMTTVTGQFVARTRPDPSVIAADPLTDGRAVYIYTSAGRLVKYGQ